MRLVLMTLLSGLAWAQVSSSVVPAVNPTSVAPMQRSSTAPDTPVDPNSLLPELPAAPAGKATLIGGTISKLDRVRDQITIQPFGGGSMKILFDGRTQIWRDGDKALSRDLRAGEKAYVDTVLDGTTIFAKNIRVVTQGTAGESRGQVVNFDRTRSEMTLNDGLSPQTFKVQIGAATKIFSDGKETSTNVLKPGTLVAVQFRPAGPGRVAAQQISVLASPGTTFTFVGRVIFLDMPKGLMVLVDPRDKKSYEVHFNPNSTRINGDLQIDSDVTVNAAFDGTNYATNAIMVNANSVN
jgi:hypothetical protein